jgi:hypothetical protein
MIDAMITVPDTMGLVFFFFALYGVLFGARMWVRIIRG